MFDKVLSMLTVLNIPGLMFLLFWMCQSFGCTRVLNMPLVFNMPGLWMYQSSVLAKVTQGSEYAWIILEYAWIYLIMSEYVWICLNMLEYVYICLNGFCFTFPQFPTCFTIPFLLEHVVTWLNFKGSLEVVVWKNMKMGVGDCESLFIYPSSVLFFLSQNL